MIKTSFEEFIYEKYTLTIEDSMDDFDIPDVKWELEYNVSDIWSNYRKNKNTEDFLKNYKNKLLEQKDKLVKISKDCWNDLVKLIKEKNEDNILPYLDKYYDWADKYGIKITTKQLEINNIKEKIEKMKKTNENLHHVKSFQLFEKAYDPGEGESVMITYWLTQEPVPVKIVKRYRNNTYLVSFDVEGSTARGAPETTIRNSDIISPAKEIRRVDGPGYISNNTNLNNTIRNANQVSNDMYL